MHAGDSAEPTALATDLYELTMAASYAALGMQARATFSLFVRKLPGHRSFLVACGLEHALHWLSALRFDIDDRRLPNRLVALNA